MDGKLVVNKSHNKTATMSSPSFTRPPYLEEDLLSAYRDMILPETVAPTGPPVPLAYLASIVSLDSLQGLTLGSPPQASGPAQGAPEDPIGPLEQDDRAASPDSLHESEAGKTILPQAVPTDPSGLPNLHPAPASDISRPVTPFKFPDTSSKIDWADDDPGSQYGQEESFIPGPHPSVTLQPLLLDPASSQAFRRRVREALSGINESEPVPTLSSLMAMVDELERFEQRLTKLEREVARDRAALSHAMSETAKSETAGSEMRILLQVEALRKRMDSLKGVALPSAPAPASSSTPISPTVTAPGRHTVPRSERL
jgi:hypothetical protein